MKVSSRFASVLDAAQRPVTAQIDPFWPQLQADTEPSTVRSAPPLF